MFLERIGRDNRLIMWSLLTWALGEGLWINMRQLYLVDLGATTEQVAYVLAIEGALRAVMPFLAGFMASKYGPYQVMLASWVIGIMGPILMILSQTWQMATVGLVVYGMSYFAMPVIAAYALISLNHDPALTDRTLTALFASYYAGLIISSPLGGLIAEIVSLRSAMIFSMGPFAVSIVLIFMVTKVEHQSGGTKANLSALIKNGSYWKLVAFFGITYIAIFIGSPLLPNFLRDVRHLSFIQIGILMALLSGGTVIFNTILGKMPHRWNYSAALLLVGLAYLGLTFSPSFSLLVPAILCLGALATTRALASAGIAHVTSPAEKTLAFGILEAVLASASSLSALIAGALYPVAPDHHLPFMIGFIAAPIAASLFFLLPLSRSRDAAAGAVVTDSLAKSASD